MPQDQDSAGKGAAMPAFGRHGPKSHRTPFQQAGYSLLYRLPRPLRWRIVRRTGPKTAVFLQWIYDGDGPASLKGMRRHEAIFFHVPKAAGRSIVESLLDGFAGSHADADDFLCAFGSAYFDRAFKFTFVRDPWSRTVSAYEFLAKGGMNKTDAAFGKDVLGDYENADDFVLRGLGRPEVQSFVHFRPQVSFLSDPRTGRLAPDFIGRYERLAEDFAAVADRLGVTARLPHANAGPQRPPASLSDEAVAKIAGIYAEDVLKLGYDGYYDAAKAS